MQPLPRDFLARETAAVARELLGALLVKETPQGRMVGRVVETEAYQGPGDPASHAGNGATPRSAIMFGQPGIAYVYLNYGVHCLLNVVTEPDGVAGAVLLRALEPLEGIELMRSNRGRDRMVDLASGPGRLTKALGVTLADNGVDLTEAALKLCMGPSRDFEVRVGSRIGVSRGAEAKLRFYVAGSPFVSRGDGLRAASDRAPARDVPEATPGSTV